MDKIDENLYKSFSIGDMLEAFAGGVDYVHRVVVKGEEKPEHPFSECFNSYIAKTK